MGAKCALRGGQIFSTMANSFKLCPTHFSRGANIFAGGASPPGYGPDMHCAICEARVQTIWSALRFTVIKARYNETKPRSAYFLLTSEGLELWPW